MKKIRNNVKEKENLLKFARKFELLRSNKNFIRYNLDF